MAFEIIDTHLHVYDLKLKASFPNQNWTIVDFPDPVNEKAIAMDTTQEYAKEIARICGLQTTLTVWLHRSYLQSLVIFVIVIRMNLKFKQVEFPS